LSAKAGQRAAVAAKFMRLSRFRAAGQSVAATDAIAADA